MLGGMNIYTAAREGGASLRQLWSRVREGPFPPGSYSQSRPVEDPEHQAGLTFLGLHDGPKLAEGVITDATAVANCYRVQLEKMHGPITATLGVIGSHGAFGARSLATLPPGTKVQVIWHPQLYYGVIIASIPFAQTAGNKHIVGQISQTSRHRVDSAHQLPLRLSGGGFVTDWMAGRPFDATNAGEQGWITETGMRVLVDSFMAMLGLDESCSLTTFYHDQLMRIAAYNLRMFTAGAEREGLDDQGEYNDWTGYTPYPWEQMGMFARQDPRRELPPQAWQIDQPWYGNWEPKDDRQAPWHRDTEYHGYFGQGGKRVLRAPPVSPPPFHKFAPGSGRTQFPVLADQSVGLDGRLSIASAKGISIVKRIAIPGATRLYVPEQVKDEGDNEKNYKAAGIVGGGPAHRITGDLRASGRPELTKATSVLDLHAYWFNYAANVGFYYHAKDQFVPEENELQHTGGVTAPAPQFSRLAGEMFLEAPDPMSIKVDHRYDMVDYYRTTSGVELLDDGGVVIYDGFGSSIVMTAGHVYIDGPGDVWVKAGRTATVWGGDDAVVRAKHSVDVTCTEKDVRIKAEKNLHMLGGNSGSAGGVLIESRAPSQYDFDGKCGEDVLSGGVMLRATKGEVVNWASRIYLRTGGGDIAGGPICLDADRGQQPLVVHAQTVQTYTQGGLFLHFAATEEGEVEKTTVFARSASGIASPLIVDGTTTLAGNLVMRGNILVADGHVVTERAQTTQFVLPLSGEALQKVYDAVAQGEEIVNKTIPTVGVDLYASVLNPLFYAEERPGNDDVIRQAEFSLRTVPQYGTEGFELFESRWQQLGRLAGTATQRWPEKPVACRADPKTYPYPGKENFLGEKLKQLPLEIFDAAAGVAKPRGEQPNLQAPYVDPKYGDEEPVSLNKYIVIR